jgi:hypothetical protein
MSLYPQGQGKNTALTWLKASVKPLTDRSRVDGKSQRPPILALRSAKTGIALSTEQNAPDHAKSNYQPNPRLLW